jgi:hypothetical protein
MQRYLTPDDVCELVPGLTKAILAQLRFKKQGPRFYKPTLKTVIYREDEIMEWLESTVVHTTEQAANGR